LQFLRHLPHHHLLIQLHQQQMPRLHRPHQNRLMLLKHRRCYLGLDLWMAYFLRRQHHLYHLSPNQLHHRHQSRQLHLSKLRLMCLLLTRRHRHQ